MGCATSKHSRCRHCQSPYTPMPRSYSMHVHHQPDRKGDSYHVVALTSSTLGSLKLDSAADQSHHHHHHHLNGNDGQVVEKRDDVENFNNEDGDKNNGFLMRVMEATAWSNMINEKIPKIIPKTPIRTPPGEPETINTWELMEGLEDTTSPFRSPNNHFRSFSFDVVSNPIQVPFEPPPKSRLQENGKDFSGSVGVVPMAEEINLNSKLQENGVLLDSPRPNDLNSKLEENGTGSPKPMWLQMADKDSNSKSLISEFDPDVISTFRKSLGELSPDNPFYLRPPDSEKPSVTTTSNDDKNNKPLDVTEGKKINGVMADCNSLQCGKEKVVVYFTSLRGVRKTYEDCCHVRVILKGLGLRVDERDVSMHSGFKDELKELSGDGFAVGGLPRVFVGKKYIGSAEEIRLMHEEGQLEKVLKGCEMVDDGGGGGGVCESCGDIRFVPCETCSGSCKIYYEGDEDDEEETEGEDGIYGFQRCPDCNENGLIRCPICCDY